MTTIFKAATTTGSISRWTSTVSGSSPLLSLHDEKWQYSGSVCRSRRGRVVLSGRRDMVQRGRSLHHWLGRLHTFFADCLEESDLRDVCPATTDRTRAGALRALPLGWRQRRATRGRDQFSDTRLTVPPAYPVPPPDCKTFPREHIFPVYFQKLHGTDATHIWAVGNTSGAFGFGIIRFFNGQTWHTQLSQATRRLNAVAASSSAVWTRRQRADSRYVERRPELAAADDAHRRELVRYQRRLGNVLWAVGTNGTILKTSNGGQGWFLQASATNQTLASVAPLPNQEAWAVGDNGTILHTRDGGRPGFQKCPG